MKAVYVLTALVGLGLATWICILVVNGVRSWLRKREEKKVAEAEKLDRWLNGDSRDSGSDGL
jgi:hypothetical protein